MAGGVIDIIFQSRGRFVFAVSKWR